MTDELNPYQPPRTRNEVFRQRNEVNRDKEQRGEKLVVLATFENSAEAHLLRAELGKNGIHARLANEETKAALGFSILGSMSAFWVEVLVLESDAEKALLIKQKFNMKETKPIPEWTCSCGETVDAGFEQCWSCMATFDEVLQRFNRDERNA